MVYKLLHFEHTKYMPLLKEKIKINKTKIKSKGSYNILMLCPTPCLD